MKLKGTRLNYNMSKIYTSETKDISLQNRLQADKKKFAMY